ncbi:hypothetical protein ABK040_000948 [Willaertia magna]
MSAANSLTITLCIILLSFLLTTTVVKSSPAISEPPYKQQLNQCFASQLSKNQQTICMIQVCGRGNGLCFETFCKMWQDINMIASGENSVKNCRNDFLAQYAVATTTTAATTLRKRKYNKLLTRKLNNLNKHNHNAKVLRSTTRAATKQSNSNHTPLKKAQTAFSSLPSYDPLTHLGQVFPDYYSYVSKATSLGWNEIFVSCASSYQFIQSSSGRICSDKNLSGTTTIYLPQKYGITTAGWDTVLKYQESVFKDNAPRAQVIAYYLAQSCECSVSPNMDKLRVRESASAFRVSADVVISGARGSYSEH